MKLKVYVYDDDLRPTRRYVDKLRKLKIPDVDIQEPIGISAFREQMKELTARRLDIRKGGRPTFEGLIFDEADIFVVDYDLVKTFEKESLLTGEEVCYAARCFSNCGLLIGLNKDIKELGPNPFDLAMRGDTESFADLNISSFQLDNPGLWGSESTFRPWMWPNLLSYARDFAKRVEAIETNFEKTIPVILGMEGEANLLTKTAGAFFGNEFEKIKPTQFVLKTRQGLRGKDKKASKAMIARITATRIAKWLENSILPAQEILVDAPHLVSRYPSLLSGSRSVLDSWNKTTNFNPGANLGIDRESIKSCQFGNTIWLSRPAWFWRKLSSLKEIAEVASPWSKVDSDFVFAEDCSQFELRRKCREFLAEVDSPYKRRYVRYLTRLGVNYTPKANFS